MLDPDGIAMWNKGYFGVDTVSEIDTLQKAPRNPSTQEYYDYATTLNEKEYQIGVVLENGDVATYMSSVYAVNVDALPVVE